jgi:hypothetical protein
MKRFFAVAAVVTSAVFAPSALAGNDHHTLGPAGYDTPGQSALVLAGTGGVELGSGDHVVICHAIGGAGGDRFIQIAPSSSGVVPGHDGHEGDRDIIPPYTYVDHKGVRDTSLSGGNNWFGTNIALYSQGCAGQRPQDNPPEPPKDECPNIEGFQSAVPAGFVKDASGKCICPPVTVTVNTVPQAVPEAVPVVAALPAASVVERIAQVTPKAKKKVKVKAKKAKKKVKKKAKTKAKKAKKAQRARVPRVLPFTR